MDYEELYKERKERLSRAYAARAAKDVIGDHACIIGGPPASLFLSGTPAKIDDYVRDLMEQVKEGGGFVLAPGVNIPEEADPANVKALMDAVEKHGVY